MTQTHFREAINALYRLAKHQSEINGVDWETNLVSIVKVTVESERKEQNRSNDICPICGTVGGCSHQER